MGGIVHVSVCRRTRQNLGETLMETENHTSHEDEIGSSLFNVAIQRAKQLGRDFLTAEEHRLVKVCTKFYMELKPVDMSLVLGRPQVQAQQPPVKILDHVEAAIEKAANEEVESQNMQNQPLTEPGPAVDLNHDPAA